MILDPKKITLMDFQSFNNGLNFMYILPFSGNRAHLNQHTSQEKF